MKSLFSRFVRNESGATAIEYGLIAALQVVTIIAGVTAVATDLNVVFNSIAVDSCPKCRGDCFHANRISISLPNALKKAWIGVR